MKLKIRDSKDGQGTPNILRDSMPLGRPRLAPLFPGEASMPDSHQEVQIRLAENDASIPFFANDMEASELKPTTPTETRKEDVPASEIDVPETTQQETSHADTPGESMDLVMREFPPLAQTEPRYELRSNKRKGGAGADDAGKTYIPFFKDGKRKLDENDSNSA